MPCYRPLHGFRSRHVNASGKRNIIFNQSEGFNDFPVTLPCGQCIGCRLERSRQWAMRCMHEASLYEKNCFITLTYDPKFLPPGGTLVKKHFQDFMKRLRKKFHSQKVRVYYCGEYGEKNARPHYHAILFNLDFDDKIAGKDHRGNIYYSSRTLDSLWADPETGQKIGLSVIGNVTFESAAYVARYITKKINGEPALDHYTTYNRYDGEITAEKLPEFTNMSLKPGIGAGWLEKYFDDVYPKDEVILRERKLKPPRFYDRVLEKTLPKLHAKIKSQRREVAKSRAADNTLPRLCVKELKKVLDTKKLKRSYENDT